MRYNISEKKYSIPIGTTHTHTQKALNYDLDILSLNVVCKLRSYHKLQTKLFLMYITHLHWLIGNITIVPHF